ncbi:MAG: RpiR family transcriptional regulator, partial [Streptomyces sp.]|nr:RpiR family transcriptional regulator [Streptomyces sp.]
AAGAAAAGAMEGASAVHAPSGFFNAEGGYEYAATLALAATGLAVAGPGRLSLDHALGHVFDRGWMVPTALGVTAAATALVVGARNKRLRDKKPNEQEALFAEDEALFRE